MHPLCSAVPEPYVSVGVTRAALFIGIRVCLLAAEPLRPHDFYFALNISVEQSCS